jgi:hypothetical protein
VAIAGLGAGVRGTADEQQVIRNAITRNGSSRMIGFIDLLSALTLACFCTPLGPSGTRSGFI